MPSKRTLAVYNSLVSIMDMNGCNINCAKGRLVEMVSAIELTQDTMNECLAEIERVAMMLSICNTGPWAPEYLSSNIKEIIS